MLVLALIWSVALSYEVQCIEEEDGQCVRCPRGYIVNQRLNACVWNRASEPPLYAPRATSSIKGLCTYAIHRARHAPDQQSQMVAPYVLRATTRRLRRHQACAFLAQQVTEWLLEYLDVSIAHATEIACIVLKGGN